ncbi:XrtA/PEP-CTERM system histidine kinase PrsK [Porphyrobacter sp. ULC335]|uniref:XrtA/PEP-CTERM system histidine kinase PrsK n=1 Tax=Porphyrobacter sp. ULC335 TaxID=2854260 RepID=UPI00221E8EBD|nr:XrtA/PEP-CTERM system histidine kinase PrsK [Porphyrobacter sp. ULC335]UYV14658.1 PEP-CTERM system histidine kinase PrsK [Porphyrobacter sp. ULC335]
MAGGRAVIWLGGMVPMAGFLAWLAGAVLSAGAMLWIWRNGERARPDRIGLMAASGASAIWCALAAGLGPDHGVAVIAAMVRNLALIATIFSLFAADGRTASLKPVRPVIIALVMVQLLQPVVLLVGYPLGDAAHAGRAAFEARALIDMLVAIGALMLLHNLYAGAASALRPVLRWTGMALSGIFAYDLNLHTLAYLGGTTPWALGDLRGVFAGTMAVLFALGMNAAGPRVQFSPSRAVTFRTLSLLLIGGYLAGMVLVTKSLALIGGDVARASQAVFVVAAIIAAAVALPSARIRGWMRVTATKHLFQHRYDYRQEWLRFTRTIGHGGSGGASLEERVVKALADITESPAGLLLMPNEQAQLELTARWNWPTIAVPAVAGDFALSGLLEQHNLILALDEAREGIDHQGELSAVPTWLMEAEDAWALIPLIHFDRLVGVIVLARPRNPRQLDWEDFDLLRVTGQQLASYLAEQAGQQALMDASRFDEFNRRMAFVMHDIKNLVSQLSLLAANAEKHADNPAFRADMLVTLRNSADKLSALLARLGRYGTGQVAALGPIDLVELARSIAARFAGVHPVALTREGAVQVVGDREALEQALLHLVQNAIDASEANSPVFLDVIAEGLHGTIEVVDAGKGMSPEFVRTGLFKPFVSSKSGGFGIGAFEARELVRAMGGRITVESREGLGTRFAVVLPLAEAVRLLGAQNADKPQEVA